MGTGIGTGIGTSAGMTAAAPRLHGQAPLSAANFHYAHALGPIYGFITERGLRHLRLPRAGVRAARPALLHSAANLGLGRKLHALLDGYFAGRRVDFAEIPLDLAGATPFREEVWRAAQLTGWGELSTYGALSERMRGTRRHGRAVGQALGANPVPIVVPCHRFIGANGDLTGFSAGLAWKRALLRLEWHAPA